MVPKQLVDVMSCEIVRLLQLTQNAVIPISYHVQRKVKQTNKKNNNQQTLCHVDFYFLQTYSDFHADLYPDTSGEVPAMSAEQWIQGSNAKVDRVVMMCCY